MAANLSLVTDRLTHLAAVARDRAAVELQLNGYSDIYDALCSAQGYWINLAEALAHGAAITPAQFAEAAARADLEMGAAKDRAIPAQAPELNELYAYAA